MSGVGTTQVSGVGTMFCQCFRANGPEIVSKGGVLRDGSMYKLIKSSFIDTICVVYFSEIDMIWFRISRKKQSAGDFKKL